MTRSALARTLIAACALAGAVGCVRGEPERAPGTPAPLTAAPEASGSPATTAASRSPAAELPDGRSFGFIKSVDEGARTIVDLAQWLEGDAADEAYREDTGLSGDEEVENDYYIRNDNTRLRTLHLTSNAKILCGRRLAEYLLKGIGAISRSRSPATRSRRSTRTAARPTVARTGSTGSRSRTARSR